MDPVVPVLIVVTAVVSLLFLVLKLKIHAFISLMLVSILTGYLAGMTPGSILDSIQEGMGGTLGFIAVVVGLGAIFGKILEYSGGAEALAMFMINKFGEDKAPWALSITGFIIAIPVFLDVAFIILVPILYALSRKTKKSLLFCGIPLLAGLAATHSFIPPTPGPVAVSEILGANLGWVIILGFAVGIPVVIIAGPLFGRYISNKVQISPPAEMFAALKDNDKPVQDYPAFRLVIMIIGCPLALILLNTITGALVNTGYLPDNVLTSVIIFIGHPFSALLIATFLAMYLLGIRRGIKRKKLQDISNASLGPAGIIILVTGAGGVLKQILIDSGFWLVGKYLGMDEKQTLQTWTVMETIIAVSGLLFAWILFQLV